jgi:small-conductance mechanosensitive channel
VQRLSTIAGAGMGTKLLVSVALLLLLFGIHSAVSAALRRRTPARVEEQTQERRRFWIRQAAKLGAFVLLVAGLSIIWIDDPSRFTTIAGLVTAGLAVALQRVITSLAAYLIILRGRVFTVGDRITIGGVRGDVVTLGLMQTSVMEMGEPPGAHSGDPEVWVNARQFTGRIVKITNDKIFDTPVYNYTREFPYLWEEMHFPIGYGADRAGAESILLDIARRHTDPIVERAESAFTRLRERYFVAEVTQLAPRVYLRMTDNWLEVSLRFLAPVRGVRALKDAMTRDILPAFDAAKIGIASTTVELTGLPVVKVTQVE